MPFHLHRSNRTEALAEAFASLLKAPLPNVFASECIVVQGKGMERWLSMQLAQRLDVWANPSFPFPRKIIRQAINGVLGPADAGAEAFEPDTLIWAVASLLPDLLSLDEFAPLRSYLDGDESGLKRVQLSERIARVFDNYVVYRPEMVLGWQDRQSDWQSILWRRLVDRHGTAHLAARSRDFFTAVRSGATLAADFPTRLSLFGISTLPPLYVDLLNAIAASADVHLFLLSPSREFWGEVRSRRELLRQAWSRGGGLPSEDELMAAEGNPLLASLGRLGREFQQVLEAAVDYLDDPTDLYVDPTPQTTLATLQSDVLNLRFPGARSNGGAAATDTSIRVHSCHSPMREIEVLHDQLLALFDEDPTLEARDIIVMAPSIDVYVPYIDAVFRPSTANIPRIPYRIADRSTLVAQDVSDAFFRVLQVLGGRFTASDLLDLLAIDVIRNRFGFSREDLERVRRWVIEAAIRWGVDGEHRRELGLPGTTENTWRFGLDRLLLGYAQPGDGRSLSFGVLPCDSAEGSESDALGRLAEFCELLFAFRLRVKERRPLPAWRDELTALLAQAIASNTVNAHQHQQLRNALTAIAERAELAEFADPISLDALLQQLEQEIQAGAAPHGFLSGGVTFCELVPMRTIPFRVVCLVGMNDGIFPRIRRPLGFDKIAEHPRAGDRSAREDDRYLFLEALLSVRDRLLITYVGQSISDNSVIPPSVVVSELLETLDRSHSAARDHVVVRHSLQPFSPRNFGAGQNPNLFSYAHPHFAGAQALIIERYGGEGSTRTPFIEFPLPALDDTSPRRLSLDQLVRFFEHPTRAFLQSRLGLYLGNDLPPLEDREPLELNALERWKIGDALLQDCISGEDVVQALASTRASGALPQGEIGCATFEEVTSEAAAILEIAAPLRAGESRAVEVDLALGDTRIYGVLRDLHPSGLMRIQYSKLGQRQELGFWIRHLILNCLVQRNANLFEGQREFSRESILLGRPSDNGGARGFRFLRVDNADEHLRFLLDLYWCGMSWPLPLFGHCSRAFANALRDGKPEGKAWTTARKSFRSNDSSPMQGGTDGADANVRQIYGSNATLDDVLRFQARQSLVPAFDELTRAVFFPLLQHRVELP